MYPYSGQKCTPSFIKFCLLKYTTENKGDSKLSIFHGGAIQLMQHCYNPLKLNVDSLTMLKSTLCIHTLFSWDEQLQKWCSAVWPIIHPFVHLSMHQFVCCSSICLSVYLSVYKSDRLSARFSVHFFFHIPFDYDFIDMWDWRSRWRI